MTLALDAEEADALQAIGWRPAVEAPVCPDSSLLLAAEDGVLDDAIAERVLKHVASCATCQLLAKDLAAVLAEEPTEDTSARLRAQVGFGRKPARRTGSLWIGAGGLLAAAAVVWFFVIPRSSPLPVPDALVAKATPPPIPSVFIVSRPAIPPGDVDLTVRGEAVPRVSLPNQIANALDRADAGDLASATADLANIVGRNPASRSAALALGAVQLRANQNADAAATLERARALKTDPELTDETDWFVSMALVRIGHRERARTLLDGVCKRGGARGTSACVGILEIDRSQR